VANVETLILLRDFEYWFQQLPLRLPGISIQQLAPIRERALECLKQTVVVNPNDLKDIRELTESRRDESEFILAMDGGTYFREYDFSFAMTRAVTRLTDATRGRMIRVAREGVGQFWTQVAILRREFEASPKSSIVVCDDGIDTGRSLAEVVRQLNEQYLEVSRIRVILNPHGIETIESVPVETITNYPDCLWTHERDLFWGSPGGGVSLITRDNVNQLYGIPYTLTSQLLKKRLGISGLEPSGLGALRRELLAINRDFWLLLSRAAGRSLRLRDCKRLMWAVELNDFSDRSLIVDVIDWLEQNDLDM
jgi:protein-tyrosine-phosphatase